MVDPDEDLREKRIAVMCLGNLLMLDEGVGPEVCKRLNEGWDWPDNVRVLDAGTMGMALLSEFPDYDYILTVDAVDDTGKEPGTVFHFWPDDIAANPFARGAHDTRFADVLEAGNLLGYHTVGECVGIQVQNMCPSELCIGLTPKVEAAVPLLCQTVIAILYRHGIRDITDRSTGLKVAPPEPDLDSHS